MLLFVIIGASYAEEKPLARGALDELAPLDEFDDRILPVFLYRLTMILYVMTVVLQVYRMIAAVLIYQMAVKQKIFWRKLVDECRLRKRQAKLTEVASSRKSQLNELQALEMGKSPSYY